LIIEEKVRGKIGGGGLNEERGREIADRTTFLAKKGGG